MDEELQVPPTATQDEIDAIEEELFQEIREFFVAFLKTVRAAQFYVEGNPILHQFIADIRDRLDALWDRLPVLSFNISENEVHWRGRPVYQAQGLQDNIAFEFYKDGIRRIAFHPGAEREELIEFLDVIRLARQLKEGDEDDLLTLMWHQDFQFIRYEYVDVLADEDLPEIPSEMLLPAEGERAELPQLPELELDPELETQVREDFEPALYFLDEEEISRLQRELRGEWERPTKQAVVTALLDQFEVGDLDRRYEVVRILQELLPRILADGEFKLVALILQELEAIARRHDEASIRERVAELGEELSRPDVLEQLVRVMEDGAVRPTSESLGTLLSALRPSAMVSLIQLLPSVGHQETREQLYATLERLAGQNLAQTRELLGSEDPRVAAESARIAGRLELTDLAEPLAALVERKEEEVRLAGVEALSSLRSSMAGRPLVSALQDTSRKVRVAAAKGLAELQFAPAAEQLESRLRDKELWHRDLTEQLAFFEAYARAAGEESVRLLNRLLNGRRFLWFRYPGQLRACAARALGLIDGDAAAEALARGEGDKDPMVRSAVQAARSGEPAGRSR